MDLINKIFVVCVSIHFISKSVLDISFLFLSLYASEELCKLSCKFNLNKYFREILLWISIVFGLLFVLIIYCPDYNVYVTVPKVGHSLSGKIFYLILGPLIYLLLDSLSDDGFFFLQKKMSLGIFKKGSINEYVMVAIYFVLVLFFDIFVSKFDSQIVSTLFFKLFAIVFLFYACCHFMISIKKRNINGNKEIVFVRDDSITPSPIAELNILSSQDENDDTVVHKFNDPHLNEAWGELICPYEKIICDSHFLTVVEQIFKIFDEIGHAVPSVYGLDAKNLDKNPEDYSLLKGVSLVDHSLRVARLTLTALKSQTAANEYWVFNWVYYLIPALAHDISKAGIVYTQGYSTGNHGINSANFLASLFRDLCPDINKELYLPMIELVRDHHFEPANQKDEMRVTPELKLIQRCDREAREIEKDRMRKKLMMQDDSQPLSDPHTETKKGATISVAAVHAHEPAVQVDTVQSPQTKTQPGPRTTQRAPVVNQDDDMSQFTRTIGEVKRIIPMTHIVPGTKAKQNVRVESREMPGDLVAKTMLSIKENYINRQVNNKSFYAFSQKDGYIYIWVDIVYENIQVAATNLGLSSPWFTEWNHKKSVLMSFYDYFRSQKMTPPSNVVGDNFFANSYYFFNPLAKGYSSGYYMVIRAEAFGEGIEIFEAKRKTDKVLVHIEMKKGKPPQEDKVANDHDDIDEYCTVPDSSNNGFSDVVIS